MSIGAVRGGHRRRAAEQVVEARRARLARVAPLRRRGQLHLVADQYFKLEQISLDLILVMDHMKITEKQFSILDSMKNVWEDQLLY